MNKTTVKYVEGLDPRYSTLAELQQYSTFDDVCALSHKVEQQRKSKPFRREFPKHNS